MSRPRVQPSTRSAHASRPVVAVALLALTLAACAERRQPVSAPAPAPPLRVGIAPNFPPLAFKQTGNLAGIEVDFAQQLGPALGMKMMLVETPWDELIPALRDHRIDVIMSGMSVTPARQKRVRFAHPYLRVGQMMVLRRADAGHLRTAKMVDQRTTRVGFISETTGEAYVHAHLPRAHATAFASIDAGAAALRARQIDVFVADAPAIYALTATSADPHHELLGRYEPLTEEYLAWAVRLDDAELQSRLNTVLSSWNSDGTLERVLGKWIHVRRKPRPAK